MRRDVEITLTAFKAWLAKTGYTAIIANRAAAVIHTTRQAGHPNSSVYERQAAMAAIEEFNRARSDV
jgi:hypothetical protein